MSVYRWRHDLFRERLEKMSVRFQPIICFNMDEPFISGYEALASDPETDSTPHDLLTAAEKWGDHFKIHLDSYFFKTAIESYNKIIRSTPGKRRAEEIQELSINVYPETLIRSAYFRAVKAVVDKKLLPKDKLQLELSEKSPLPTKFIPGDGIITKDMISFRDVLYKYVNQLGISFALDDFGVGYSSVSRLATLTPNYIKIDREILLADTAYDTLQFIVNYAHNIVSRRILRQVKVVVEGFDEEKDIKISLSDMLSLGIDYIQSFIIGYPTEQLIRLNPEQHSLLISLRKK